MAELKVNIDKCVGCKLCVKACAFNVISIVEKKAVVNSNCTLCGMCIESCNFEALSIENNILNSTDTTIYSGIWVFAEQHNSEVLPVAYELLGKGRYLAKKRGCELTAILLGNDISTEINSLIAHGADKVIACDDKELEKNSDDCYAEVFDKLIGKYKPETLLFGATGFGRSLAPRIAGRVSTGLTADCTSLEISNETGLLEQTRPAFGGNLMATIICPYHRPQMATVRPGVFEVVNANYARKGKVVEIKYESTKNKLVKILEEISSQTTTTIADAEVIVSVGRGIGSQKNIVWAKKLAKHLGGKVGVTRPLVDLGWSEYQSQIGQTGSSVSPKLLIACGISGAVQHLAGISGAKTIIAINSDPDAPIFSVADYKVVGDCVEILKKMVSLLS